jgi:hypothetical protein
MRQVRADELSKRRTAGIAASRVRPCVIIDASHDRQRRGVQQIFRNMSAIRQVGLRAAG